MGLYDEYAPDPPLACPSCGALLSGWQGKDGPCLLLRWHQGDAIRRLNPALDADFHAPEVTEPLRLPPIFDLYTSCDACKAWVDATGHTENGVWARTVLGRVWIASLEPTFPDESPRSRRRCGRCEAVWTCDPSVSLVPCPGCGVPTRLADG